MRRDLRRGRDLQGLHWQCRVCRTLALWGAPGETAVTVWHPWGFLEVWELIWEGLFGSAWQGGRD